jgi:hypothetical protein
MYDNNCMYNNVILNGDVIYREANVWAYASPSQQDEGTSTERV